MVPSATIYDCENGVESSEIDLQTILLSRENIWCLAAPAARSTTADFSATRRGRAVPDLGFYYRPWQLGVSAQAGYGNAHQYGQISMYKQLSWVE